MLPKLNYAQYYLHADTPTLITKFSIKQLTSVADSIVISGDAYLVDVNDQNIGKVWPYNEHFVSSTEDSSSRLKGIYVSSDAMIEIKYNSAPAAVGKHKVDFRDISYSSINLDGLKQVYASSYIDELFLIPHIIKGSIDFFIEHTTTSLIIAPANTSNDVVDNLSDIEFPSEKISLRLFQLQRMPNLKGSFNHILDEYASNAKDSWGNKTLTVIITDCPLIKYNNEYIGSDFRKTFTIDCANHTWSENE
jgi:hypothetical protein